MAQPLGGAGCGTQAAPAACLRDCHVAAVGSGPQRARQADAAVGAGTGLHPNADVKALLPAAAGPSCKPRHQEGGRQLHLPQAAGRRVAAQRHQHLRTGSAIVRQNCENFYCVLLDILSSVTCMSSYCCALHAKAVACLRRRPRQSSTAALQPQGAIDSVAMRHSCQNQAASNAMPWVCQKVFTIARIRLRGGAPARCRGRQAQRLAYHTAAPTAGSQSQSAAP